jgi:hypothetical protein
MEETAGPGVDIQFPQQSPVAWHAVRRLLEQEKSAGLADLVQRHRQLAPMRCGAAAVENPGETRMARLLPLAIVCMAAAAVPLAVQVEPYQCLEQAAVQLQHHRLAARRVRLPSIFHMEDRAGLVAIRRQEPEEPEDFRAVAVGAEARLQGPRLAGLAVMAALL